LAKGLFSVATCWISRNITTHRDENLIFPLLFPPRALSLCCSSTTLRDRPDPIEEELLCVREHPETRVRTAKSLEVQSRSSFPPAAPAPSCHASHRGHMCQVSRVNSSFSSVIGHKTREKSATGHCSRQNIIASASTVLPAILNVRLGALREQQQLREGCFPEMVMHRGLEPPSNVPDSISETHGTPPRVRERCRADALVPVAPRTLAESSRGKVLAMLAEPVKWGRRIYTPHYVPDKARDTSPRVHARFSTGALVPAAPCVHAATLRRLPPLWGQLDFAPERGAGSRNIARRRPA